MKLIISKKEFEAIKKLAKRFTDEGASFSTNPKEELWASPNWGLTPEENREHIQSAIKLLTQIKERLLALRPKGGRFFIDSCGAYYKDAEGVTQFVSIKIYEGDSN